MSEWHKNWQSLFPERNREVGLPFGNPIHRADILAWGHVIEIQKSKITREEFNERNKFYTSLGYKVIWIFDARELIAEERLENYDSRYEGKGQYSLNWRWNYAWKIFTDWNPVRNKNIKVFFQVPDNFDDYYYYDDEIGDIQEVVWAINEYGKTNMRRFITSDKIETPKDLMEYLESEYNKKHKQVA